MGRFASYTVYYEEERGMATRTVRLDDDSEEMLRQLTQETGLSISGVLKRGLQLLRERLKESPRKSAYEIYKDLDLGPGGYATAPSTDSRRGVKEAIRRKHGR
jgi:hypothetical protein